MRVYCQNGTLKMGGLLWDLGESVLCRHIDDLA